MKQLTNDQIYDLYNEPRSDAEMVEFANAVISEFCRINGITSEAQPAAMQRWQIMPTVKDRATNLELHVVGVYEEVVFVDVPAIPEKAVAAWRGHGANTGMRHPEESDLYDGSEHAKAGGDEPVARVVENRYGGRDLDWFDLRQAAQMPFGTLLYIRPACDADIAGHFIRDFGGIKGRWQQCKEPAEYTEPLYTTPPAQPAREWVGLTDSEVTICHSRAVLSKKHDGTDPSFTTLLHRAIESKLREKNAGLPAAVPDGYVLVPVEPTDDMVLATITTAGNYTREQLLQWGEAEWARDAYRAMLAAAPKPQPPDDDHPLMHSKYPPPRVIDMEPEE